MYHIIKTMVQMLFFIRFRAQLRRTRPELVTSLEDTVAASASAAGASVETGGKVLEASFDDKRIGFWLDLGLFLEKVHDALKNAASELYGYTLVLGHDIPEASARKLCRQLSVGETGSGTGIWCSQEVREVLEFYMGFCRPGNGIPAKYRELKEFKLFTGPGRAFPFRDKIERTLSMSDDKNTLLLGPETADRKDGIFHYAAGRLGEIPPLVVRFGAGGRGLICFADAYTPLIRSFLKNSRADLDSIHVLLFRERLRDEWSPYVREQCCNFIRSLLTEYSAAAGANGMLILEDISLVDADTIEDFKKIYLSLNETERPLVMAIDNSHEDTLRGWSGIFSRILKFSTDDLSAQEKPGLLKGILSGIPRDLWELSYNIFLLGQYFPSYLFPQLFEEQGLNKDIYFRAIKILETLGIFIQDDPRPQIPDFSLHAEEILGRRKEKVWNAVRSRILGWALSGKLRPCFNLLRILSELGERAGDELVLRSIRADVLNGTFVSIEKVLQNGYFSSLVGAGNARVLVFIYKTLKALVWGTNREIQLLFQEPVPSLTLEDGKLCYEGCRAQIQANLAAYYIGSRNIEAASEALRKAMLLNQELGDDAVPAYRLFSLMNLSRQRLDDALEYNSFALDQAERTEQQEELVLICYYAASVNLLYGNLSRAQQFAVRAEKTAAEFGLLRWGEKARFLRGRLFFEIGRYKEALEIFEPLGSMETYNGVDSEGIPASSEMAQTARAWVSRTRVFMDRFPLENITGLDGEIFKIEAAYFAADYGKAISLAGNFLSSASEMPKTDFLFTEQPDWRSGFCQCEYLFQSDKVPGMRMAWVYRAMAQAALRPSQEMTEEILSSMQRFIRDELLPDTDPNDSFYFYAWYCMLRDTGAAQVDMNTVVSMANKRLQRRASRIDDLETKQDFFNLSRWNKTLSLAARENKFL